MSDINTLAINYGKQTSQLYEQAEHAKNLVKYLKDTDPIRYNLKINEINQTALEQVNEIELKIQKDITDRFDLAQRRFQTIQSNIRTNYDTVSTMVANDIKSGAIM